MFNIFINRFSLVNRLSKDSIAYLSFIIYNSYGDYNVASVMVIMVTLLLIAITVYLNSALRE